ncbi:MAG: methylmalonyl-CoA mutase family protein [Bacteroidota bacterium]
MPFPEVSKAEWLAKVEKDLKGKPLSSLDFSLAGETLSPFWHAEDLPALPPPLPQSKGWKIGVHLPVTDIATGNEIALRELMGGVEYLYFTHHGLIRSPEDRAALLSGIFQDMVDIVVHDTSLKPWQPAGLAELPATLIQFAELPEVPVLWLRAPQDFYLNLATVRAARACLELIQQTKGARGGLQIGVVVSPEHPSADTSKIDASAKAVAAVAGGADILLVDPSDHQPGSTFSRRIARNVQHLLQQESYLNRVADPAAGSYFLENLTDTLARNIWTEFQSL